ncbi:hypothetical protein AVEN_249943-1 [Araneus ventricosus]|uniref:Uncharacterized protein n=1 Tax=Araneus ventricosus TaxID=182803 RepID=A0A4Y2JZ80_ARAVE|nr:hypothetical protein AVEN_249943-1 [Araneus ventricosus]
MSAFPEFFVRSRSAKCKHHPSVLHFPPILMKITPSGACAEARRFSESVAKQYLKGFHLSDSHQCSCGGIGTALHYAKECGNLFDSDQFSCGGIGTALHYARECALIVSWHMREPTQTSNKND